MRTATTARSFARISARTRAWRPSRSCVRASCRARSARRRVGTAVLRVFVRSASRSLAVPIPPFNYLFLCGSCCYDIPDRKDFNKQNYAEVLVSTACCANVCGRVQLAQQLGIKGWDLEGVKKDTTAAGRDVQVRRHAAQP